MNKLVLKPAGKALVLLFVLSFQCFSQSNYPANGMYSPQNIKKFADYLFCTKDYLRAAIEYQKYQDISFNDTVQFKIGFSYSEIGSYQKAEEKFSGVPENSNLFFQSRVELLKSIFLSKEYDRFRNEYNFLNLDNKYLKLYNFSFLEDSVRLPDESDFLKPYSESEKSTIQKFYEFKSDPPYKSPLKAAILSSIIPGMGKIYTGKISDGITSFILVGLMTFLSVDNFNAHHYFRGWVFGGLSAFFYAGNIYGSAASAQIKNAEMKYNFSIGINSYLKINHFFLPEIEFCK